MSVDKPVAIRVVRPYGSEAAFIAEEADTITRSTIVLVNAQQRPAGVILRFEVVLETGTPLLRGEGRVVQHRPNGPGVLGGLVLRFTKLDAKSKALVDSITGALGPGAPPSVNTAAPVAAPAAAGQSVPKRGSAAPAAVAIDADAAADRNSPTPSIRDASSSAAAGAPSSDDTTRPTSIPPESNASLAQAVLPKHASIPAHADPSVNGALGNQALGNQALGSGRRSNHPAQELRATASFPPPPLAPTAASVSMHHADDSAAIETPTSRPPSLAPAHQSTRGAGDSTLPPRTEAPRTEAPRTETPSAGADAQVLTPAARASALDRLRNRRAR